MKQSGPLSLSDGNPMRTVLMVLLIFDVLVFGLSIPVMLQISDASPGAAAGFGGGAAVLALVGAGLMRKPIGYPIGWLTQVAGVALGFVTPTMFLVGGMFAGLWVVSFILGKRLDANRPPDKVAA